MTGGGTAGHVTPNIALMPALQEAGYEITYIGSYNGMEKELIEAQKSLISEFLLENFAVILTGKLSDPFKVLKDMAGNLHPAQTQTGRCLFQRWICVCSGCPCRKALPYSGNYPRIRYHTGTCKQNRNPRCKKVCCNFPETMKYLPAEKQFLPVHRSAGNCSTEMRKIPSLLRFSRSQQTSTPDRRRKFRFQGHQ